MGCTLLSCRVWTAMAARVSVAAVWICVCVCMNRGHSDTANLHHICWAFCCCSARSSEGHEENLSRVMNMSLWCFTNVRLWLRAAICKTTLQLLSTYCWYDLWHSQGRQGIVTVQTVVIKLREMSWTSVNNKIAMWFCCKSYPPLKDLIQAYQELKIWLSLSPRADGVIAPDVFKWLWILSSNGFEYSGCNAGLQAQQVVGPLISTHRCLRNLNHRVTSSSWNHNMNCKFQLWS